MKKMKKMKKKLVIVFTLLLVLVAVGCGKSSSTPTNKNSIIPKESFGRENVVLDTIRIKSKKITIKVWDHGKIDGDIVSIYVNGEKVIDEQTLDGPSSPISVDTDLKFNGYNYVLLYAHNEGSVSPNTCTLEINDGVTPKQFELQSNLQTNGTVDVVVE